MNWFTATDFRDQSLFTHVFFTPTWQILVRSEKFSRQLHSPEPRENFSHANKSSFTASNYLYSEINQ